MARRKHRGHWAFNATSKLLGAWKWGVGITAHELASRYIDTPTPCSCNLCGNPRRHYGRVTHQERRASMAGEA